MTLKTRSSKGGKGRKEKKQHSRIPEDTNEEHKRILKLLNKMSKKYGGRNNIPQKVIQKFEQNQDVLIGSIHLDHGRTYSRRTPDIVREYPAREGSRNWIIYFADTEVELGKLSNGKEVRESKQIEK